MVVGAKVCELTDGFLWFVCGNFDVSPYQKRRSAVFLFRYVKQYFMLLTFGG